MPGVAGHALPGSPKIGPPKKTQTPNFAPRSFGGGPSGPLPRGGGPRSPGPLPSFGGEKKKGGARVLRAPFP